MTNLLYLLITILLSAFFSGMEIAFISSSKMRFEVSNKTPNITSRIIALFYRHPDNFISTMLVGNNIVLVVYGIIFAHILEHPISILIGNEWIVVLVQTVLSTLLILVTAEFLPKILFRIDSNLSLSLFAIPAFVCYVVLYPISRFTSAISKLFLRLIGTRVNPETGDKVFTRVDLDDFIESSIANVDDQMGTEVKIFQNVLDFSTIKIRDCMIPRTEIVACEYNASIDELKVLFETSGISKIIVYKETIDNVVGYIHSSEMFRCVDCPWTSAIRDLPFVPETMNAPKLMKLFMQQKRSLAVVVDEFGGTSGIVALEDLVEEIFGEIEDEHDVNSSKDTAIDLGDGEYDLSGRLEITQVNDMFGLDLPESEEYQTLAGLILHSYQNFPKLYDVVTIGRFQFKITALTQTKIGRIRLKVLEE